MNLIEFYNSFPQHDLIPHAMLGLSSKVLELVLNKTRLNRKSKVISLTTVVTISLTHEIIQGLTRGFTYYTIWDPIKDFLVASGTAAAVLYGPKLYKKFRKAA